MNPGNHSPETGTDSTPPGDIPYQPTSQQQSVSAASNASQLPIPDSQTSIPSHIHSGSNLHNEAPNTVASPSPTSVSNVSNEQLGNTFQHASQDLPPSPEPNNLFQSNATPTAHHPAPVYGQSQQPVFYGTTGAKLGTATKPRKRILLFGGLTAGFMLLAGAGYVFGYYIPHKPENVWKTGLQRSGIAAEKIVNSATEKERLEAIKKAEIQASVDVEAKGEKFSGSIDAKYDPKKGNYKISFDSGAGAETEQKIAAEVISELKDGQTFPDSFFRINGLSTFGADSYFPELSQYEGKWISVSGEYLKSLISESQTDEEDITDEDVVEITKAIVTTTREYVLTSDETKSILENREFVGIEKVDDITAYHYVVGINKGRAKDYCQTLIERLYKTSFFKKFPAPDGTPLEEEMKTTISDCKKEIDFSVKDDETFDMWIDKKYKIIHKTRFTEKGKDVYFEVGQKYKGGDEITIFGKYHDGTENAVDGTLTIEVDTKSSQMKVNLSIEGGEDDGKYKVGMTLEAKPYDGEINTSAPSESIPIEKVLGSLGLSNYLNAIGDLNVTNYDQYNPDAEDAERQSDINAIHGQLEAYYATSGYYPTLEQINNSSWVVQNFPGLDQEAFIDPIGSVPQLVAESSFEKYMYTTSTCIDAKSQCQSYELSAFLNDGSTYTKKSLN